MDRILHRWPSGQPVAAYLTPKHQLITPAIVLDVVDKKIKRERGEETALLFADGSVQPRWFN